MKKVVVAIALMSAAAGAGEPAVTPLLDAKTVRGLFGPQFAPLDALPVGVVTDSEQHEKLVADLTGCPTRDEGADEFEIADCQKRSAELKSRKEPIYLTVEVAADDLRYDFKRRGWVVTFTDDFGGLSVWKPAMPERIERKKCDDFSDESRACYPLQLPQTFKRMTLFVPMDEAEARAWRDAETPDARLSFLVSVRQGTQWTKTWTRWFIASEARYPHRYAGMLARVHAMTVRLGKRSWAFPEWWGVARDP